MRSLLVAVACLIALVPAVALAGVLAPDEALERSARGELVIVDVRTPKEWAATGLPQGALPIALQNSLGLPRLGFARDVRDALGGDLERPVALICATGVRSSFAARLLQGAGFGEVYDIAEGMSGGGGPGWIARGLDLEPCPVC
jgi:rhodanese-related sulfurtransferase